jgi:hypothetical protein
MASSAFDSYHAPQTGQVKSAQPRGRCVETFAARMDVAACSEGFVRTRKSGVDAVGGVRADAGAF